MELNKEELNELIEIYSEIKDLYCKPEMMVYNIESTIMKFSKWITKTKGELNGLY